jgi:hypothetical protein
MDGMRDGEHARNQLQAVPPGSTACVACWLAGCLIVLGTAAAVTAALFGR